MKKILTILSMAVFLIGFTNCTNSSKKELDAKNKLKEEIAAENKNCPIDMGFMGCMTSIEYDEQKNEVKFKYLLNDDFDPITLMDAEGTKDLMKMGMYKNEIDIFIDAGASIVYEFKGALTGKCSNVKLTLEDLKDIKNNPMSEDDINKNMLKLMIARESSLCPMEIDEGMVMEQVYEEGDNVIYVCQVDENKGYVLEMSANEKKEMKQAMIDDPVMKVRFEPIVSLGKGLICRYYGNMSGEYVDIEFTKEELEAYL